MIAFLEHVDTSDRRGPAFAIERVYFLDVPAIKISIFSRRSKNEKRTFKNLEKAKRFLLGARVENVIFSDSFPYSKFFLDSGFLNISMSDLMHICSEKLADIFSDADGKAAIIVRELDNISRNILVLLCRKNRFVIAGIGRGASGEIEKLRRETGISIITRPSKSQLLSADLAVIMSKLPQRTVFSDSCIVVAADSGFLEQVSCKRAVFADEFGLSPENENKIIPGFSRHSQIAAAVSCFALRAEDVTLKRLNFFEHTI